MGIDIYEGFDEYQLEQFPADIFIIGNVAKRGMGVIEAILNQGLPYISGPQWLAENILQHLWVVAVAGTHGKTTTASMLAWILEYAGLAPGFLIGGIPQNFNTSARLPQIPVQNSSDSRSPFFVIEADEYDTAFFDKRSKFVHYHPRTCILNNLEFDHADIFTNLDAIETQFHHLIRTIPSEGLIICNGQEKSLSDTLNKGCWTPVEFFGEQGEWQTSNVQSDGSFDILLNNDKVGSINWVLMGEHNRKNALAAIAAARHVGIDINTSCDALTEFKNVKRRMEIKGIVNNITVYDDFAHHPTAIASTIEGLRQKVGKKRIIAVLEPRSNTMKLGTLREALPQSLIGADEVFCYTGDIDWDISLALSSLNNKLHINKDFNQFIIDIIQIIKPEDQILIMSNGGFNGIHEKILEALKEK